MSNLFKFYIIPFIPIIGLLAIINDFHGILNQEKRPVVFVLTALVQALSVFTPIIFIT